MMACRHAIIWTNTGVLSIRPLETNFSEIFIKIYTFSFKIMHFKMSSGKWWSICLGLNVLTHWSLGDVAVDLKVEFLYSLYRRVAWALSVKLLSGECHRTSLLRSHHCFRWWLGAVRPEAIIRTYVDPDLCHHIASLGYNELKSQGLSWMIT